VNDKTPTRDDLVLQYFDQLPYEPYPVQEEALLAWFTAEQGVLVCAPTGTGKTLIAEAALFEALHTGRRAYYTTPLIALTEQKFHEMQEAAVGWGFSADEIGLVTGNRSVNPRARVLVVVAEILLNRLLRPDTFDFSDVSAVVMDEFHSFADRERGIVWELSLGLLPAPVRLLLLSATVGNSAEFLVWLSRSHGRTVQLVQSTERKVPLHFEWVADRLLDEQLEIMATGDDQTRRTPALIFCFNRDACWQLAEQLKGKSLLAAGQQKQLAAEMEPFDFSQGAGPKLKRILMRGVAVHHAGLLPRYRRIVEHLFQKKLLSVTVCTETLAAGINLPARSVLLTSLLKGPPGRKTLLDPSSAHQMFGRAGRPQFDTSGYVFAISHPDDVKFLRWKERYDQIPEDTKDPNLRRAKKKLKKKMPKRRQTQQYWTDAQFQKLIVAPPGKLYSKGPLPWRLLAYLLKLSPDVQRLRTFVGKRMLDSKRIEAGERHLTAMLKTLWAGGYVTLEPEPPAPPDDTPNPSSPAQSSSTTSSGKDVDDSPKALGTLGSLLQPTLDAAQSASRPGNRSDGLQQGTPIVESATSQESSSEPYLPQMAHAQPELDRLLCFRGVNPIYGAFLVDQLGLADPQERIQALESVLDMPGSVARLVRVPSIEDLPPGRLATERLDMQLIQRGVLTADELYPTWDDDIPFEDRRWAPKFAEKLRMLFDTEFPGVTDLRTRPVWVAGDLLQQGGDFNKYVTAGALTKQEGVIFRHLLRLILLCGEFEQVCPTETDAQEWREFLQELAERLTLTCTAVDPDSTHKAIDSAQTRVDVVQDDPATTDPD